MMKRTAVESDAPSRKRKKDPQRLREKILKVATKLFLQQGYVATGMDNIAKTANVNKATIYYYFENKNQILFEILSGITQELLDLATPIATSEHPPEKRLELLVANHLKWLMGYHPGIAGIGLLGRNLLPKQKKEYAEQRDKYQELLEGVVAECFARSGTNYVDHRMATFLTVGLLNSIVQWYKSSGPMDLDEITAIAYGYISRAILSSGT